MAAPLFLDLDRTMRLHRSLIDRYGGTNGTRDVGLLHSAISMPQASFGGEYLHVVFLAMNDIEIDNDEQGLVDLTLSVATGRTGKAEIAMFFRSRAL